MFDALFGGMAGALLAILVQLWFEGRRVKLDLMTDVMRWMSDTFLHVLDLWNHDKARSEGYNDYLSDDEVRHVRHTLNRLTLPADLRARVATAFGDDCAQLRLMDDYMSEVQSFLSKFVEAPEGATPDPRNAEMATAMAGIRASFVKAARMPWVGWWQRKPSFACRQVPSEASRTKPTRVSL